MLFEYELHDDPSPLSSPLSPPDSQHFQPVRQLPYSSVAPVASSDSSHERDHADFHLQ